MAYNRVSGRHRSLEEVHRSVPVGHMRWWRRVLAFSGPAYMVSVGYMDPGNWATDLEGGASFGYRLLWVLLLSNMMAVLLQTLSARLGIVTGRDLAQACREAYNPVVRWILFFLCEIAIAACDLAEVLGTAIGLNLLLGIPLLPAVIITGFDVLLLLAIQRWGMRKMEALIVSLVFLIGACFVVELFLSKPSVGGIAGGLVPKPLSGAELFVAIGILGATVMPHNLYLHSALVQSRQVDRSREAVAQACRFNFIDSAVALNCAFFVNASILVVSAATFWRNGIHVNEIQQAHQLLDDVLGSRIAPVAFALALIAAGQSSTVTGTLAGQITMEGFLHFRMRPWLRRLITRSMAIIPAVIVISLMGDTGTYKLLIVSQVILSMQLPFAVVPLVRFTSSRIKMGPFANPRLIKVLAWVAATIIITLNGKLVVQIISEWAEAAGSWRWLVMAATIPFAVGLGVLLLWMVFRREEEPATQEAVSSEDVARDAFRQGMKYGRIGVALEAKSTDAPILAEAIALAKAHKSKLFLIHVVEGVGGQWYGEQTGDLESRHDEAYVHGLAARLRDELPQDEIHDVQPRLGYGDVVREIARIATEERLDLMVLGGHGHRGLVDLWHGQTIDGVRHSLRVPVLAVRQ
jgi:manganese transport protein